MTAEFSGDFLKWLRGFYYTAQSGSMSLAAERLKRNQSAVSQQIRSLERELGVQLFQGSKMNRSLTEEGEYLLEKTTQLFNLLNDTSRLLGSKVSPLEGEIGLATVSSLIQHYLPPQLANFCAIYPKVRFTVRDFDQQDRLFDSLLSRESDLAVVSADMIPSEFESRPLFSTELVLISPRDTPFALPRLTSLEQIAQLPVIAPPLKSTLWQYLSRMFSRNAVKLRPSHTVWSQEAVKRMVAEGMGVAMLDALACNGPDLEKLHVLPLSAFMPPRPFHAVWRRASVAPPHLTAYQLHLQDWAEARGDIGFEPA